MDESGGRGEILGSGKERGGSPVTLPGDAERKLLVVERPSQGALCLLKMRDEAHLLVLSK